MKILVLCDDYWHPAEVLERDLGKGRICVLVTGHLLSVFENAEYQKMIRQAILWCHGDL